MKEKQTTTAEPHVPLSPITRARRMFGKMPAQSRLVHKFARGLIGEIHCRRRRVQADVSPRAPVDSRRIYVVDAKFFESTAGDADRCLESPPGGVRDRARGKSPEPVMRRLPRRKVK